MTCQNQLELWLFLGGGGVPYPITLPVDHIWSISIFVVDVLFLNFPFHYCCFVLSELSEDYLLYIILIFSSLEALCTVSP